MTFDPFGDFETNGYLRNSQKQKDLAIIKKMEHDRFLANLPDAINFLAQTSTLNYTDLLEVHKILFYPFYPWAGQDRMITTPDHTVRKGNIVFANPEDITGTIEQALTQTQASSVLSGLAQAHPFLDGNGRAISVFFLEQQLRQGRIVRLDWMPRSSYLNALGQAIMGDEDQLKALLHSHTTKQWIKRSSQSSLNVLSAINWSGRRPEMSNPPTLIGKIFGK